LVNCAADDWHMDSRAGAGDAIAPRCVIIEHISIPDRRGGLRNDNEPVGTESVVRRRSCISAARRQMPPARWSQFVGLLLAIGASSHRDVAGGRWWWRRDVASTSERL